MAATGWRRVTKATRATSPETKVYLDTLPDSDFKGLQAVLDDGSFQSVTTPPAHGGIIQDMDTLYVTIPREHVMQNMSFANAAERKPFDKPLKPFVNSLKNLEKRKVPQARSETSNNCEAPRVMYRSMDQSRPALCRILISGSVGKPQSFHPRGFTGHLFELV